MSNNKPKKSSFIFYAVLTTLTLLSWAAYGAYERLVKIDLTVVSPNVLAPINPNLDTTALDLLGKKKYATPEQIQTYKPVASSESTTSAQEASPAASQ